jgi:hypothetical protein
VSILATIYQASSDGGEKIDKKIRHNLYNHVTEHNLTKLARQIYYDYKKITLQNYML